MRLSTITLATLLTVCPASAFERSADEIREQRQAIIDKLLTVAAPADVAIDRNNCMAGKMPEIVDRLRNSDGGISPNAADLCVAALMRSGTDSVIIEPYDRIVKESGGNPAAAADLPGTIGGAVTSRASDQATIGNGRAIRIDPAIAFDAGFSAAYLKGETSSPGMPDLKTLKTISESCLDQSADQLGLCYAAGYAHAVRALQGETVIAD